MVFTFSSTLIIITLFSKLQFFPIFPVFTNLDQQLYETCFINDFDSFIRVTLNTFKFTFSVSSGYHQEY